MTPNIPPFKPVPEGATEEQTQAMHEDYVRELVRLNPRFFNADGSMRTAWSAFRNVMSGRRG